MTTMKADELIEQAEASKEEELSRATEAVEWFLDEKEGMMERGLAVEELAEHLGCKEEQASRAINSLVSDIVDPVQQVALLGGEKYVGVIEYDEYPEKGAYSYENYDDRMGRAKRVVCARCVEESNFDEEITHATQGQGSCDKDASYEDLLEKVVEHYDEHESGPDEIEVGASLVSGTTISGNLAMHKGNDGSGSGFDADFVDGNDASDLTEATDESIFEYQMVI